MKFSLITQNNSPAATDNAIGVSSTGVDQKSTWQSVAALIATLLPNSSIKKAMIDWSSGIWWEELGRTTLGVAGDTISVTGLAQRKHLRIIFTAKGTGLINQLARFNNDSGNNYSSNYSVNSAGSSAFTSASSLSITNGDTSSRYLTTIDVVNTTSLEKLVAIQSAFSAAGAGSAVGMVDIRGKWANTAAPISRVDFINTNTGDFDAGAELVVLGHD